VGRSPTDRWVSQSVAKSVTSLLAGAAIRDGKLRLDDTVERSSRAEGLRLRRRDRPPTADDEFGRQVGRGLPRRDVRPGQVLPGRRQGRPDRRLHEDPCRGPILPARRSTTTPPRRTLPAWWSRAAGMPLADYLSEKIWKPYGMERDAAWHVDNQGRELAGCCLLMTLADYARLGQFALDDGVAGASASCRPAGSPSRPAARSTTAVPRRPATAISGGSGRKPTRPRESMASRSWSTRRTAW
jgi:CubicO group peptidase (beta-lactamase class C family)